MQSSQLLRRSLRHYWRTNLAVVGGVAVAVSVLAGALMVGDSVKSSLRRLVEQRLGRTETAIASTGLFRESLAASFGDAAPLLTLDGIVVHQSSGRRARNVAVYGVDDRFWSFHRLDIKGPALREAFASEAVAAELGAGDRDTLLVRLEKPSDVPRESLHGRKDETAARTLRVSLRMRLAADRLGEFSLRPRQDAVRAVFVSLGRLQRELEQPAKINTVLVAAPAGAATTRLAASFALEDAGVKLREVEGGVQVETASAVVSDALAERIAAAASRAGVATTPVLTYLANSIRAGGRSIPYSLIAAMDLGALGVQATGGIVLNEWAAADLGVRPGARIGVDYYYWSDDNRLETRSAEFPLAAVVPIRGLAADRRLAPDYPGITDADDVNNWDPPFPMNLKLIRPNDEDYWDRYRTTPKAFLALADGQRLWASRFGRLTAIRLAGGAPSLEASLRASLDPLRLGFTVTDVRGENLAASRGATDFGQYFLYFSFFLVVSALLLAGLFFRLGVEQRLREIGLLEAAGLGAKRVRRLFLAEGLVLAAIGSLLGVAGAAGYAALILYGLRTWWSDAVGTRLLALDVAPVPMVAGAVGGSLAALAAITLTLRHLRRSSPRHLLAGGLPVESAASPARRARVVFVASLAGAAALLGASAVGQVPQAGGFFGAGSLLLVAAMTVLRVALGGGPSRPIHGSGAAAALRLALRNASHRPGRAVLCCALIASATFLIVSVESFRRRDAAAGDARFPLMAESLLPLIHNPNTREGREIMNLDGIEGVRFVPMRLRPGDDASCLNLYQPRNPRILAAPPELAAEWKALDAPQPDGAVAALADANSMAYVLHRKVGDTIEITTAAGGVVRLRLVAALADSIFQSEIIVSERDFVRLFPEQQGYRMFLIDAPAADLGEVTARLEDSLADYGFDVVSTAERLAAFHRVENTYLSTFQTLGAMGLLVGTVGLAALLARNVLERRRELALLAAVGYRRGRLTALIALEHAMLLAIGLGCGTAAALVAIAPAIVARGGGVSAAALAMLLGAVLVAGLAATVAAAAAAMRGDLLPALRAE
jgi:putative ABC transport system permease protein